MDKQRLTYLLDRYLNGKASKEEMEEYDAWYAQTQSEHPERYPDESTSDAVASVDRMMTKVNAQIDKYEQRDMLSPVKLLRRRIAVAASLIFVIGSTALGIYFSGRRTTDIVLAKNDQPAQVALAVDNELLSVSNTATVIKKITLSDGSLVNLYPGSNISYRKSFQNDRREISLTGKAFFEVAKDSSKPFTVFSNNISTTALGTSFTITAITGSDNVEIMLHTGKVVVKRKSTEMQKNKLVYMVAGQRLTWSLSGDLTHLNTIAPKRPVVASIDVGSRKGFEAMFNEEPLTHVLNKISKGYSSTIRYNPSELKDMLYSGKIRSTDSLSQVLQRIALLQDLNITLKKNEYRVQKK